MFSIQGTPGIYKLIDRIEKYPRVLDKDARAEKTKHKKVYNKKVMKDRFLRVLHVWGFAVGLFFLICSRGLEPALLVGARIIKMIG